MTFPYGMKRQQEEIVVQRFDRVDSHEICNPVTSHVRAHSFTEETIYEAEVLSDDSSEDGSYSEVPEVEATLVKPLVGTVVEAPTGKTFSGTTTTVEAFPLSMRPEFLYASAILPTDGSAGLILEERPNFGVAIAALTKDSPLRGSNIFPGDHIVAINNLSCADADLARVEKLITTSKYSISICVHNTGGDPYLVSSSVQKPSASAKVGITMKMRRGVVRFNKVMEEGLFRNTLLMPHHRCMVINGISCDHMDARTVGDVIAASPDRVTIVSKPQVSQVQDCYAVTIALCEHKRWWKNVAFGAGVAAGAVAAIGSLS